jgi:hypothetical protein
MGLAKVSLFSFLMNMCICSFFDIIFLVKTRAEKPLTQLSAISLDRKNSDVCKQSWRSMRG